MIPVLFDTNIYGRIVDETDSDAVMERIGQSHFRVLDFSLIRQELRQTGKHKTLRRKKKLRPILLSMYDQIVSGSPISVGNEIVRLGEEYYAEYKRFGGAVGKKRILSDLRILACMQRFSLFPCCFMRRRHAGPYRRAHYSFRLTLNWLC